MRDSFQRKIDYLRLSITDRCNLRCSYCMPAGGVSKLSHDDILRYEELLRLARLAIAMGMSKIRVTGGEPLVRKGVVDFCAEVAALEGLRDLSITTNGVLLGRYARDLLEAGVHRVNVSLDTLRPECYAAITRRDVFAEVWRGIEKAIEVGLAPIKLNAVVIRGGNEADIGPLAALTRELPIHVRFIEFMPFQKLETDDGRDSFVSADEILEHIQRIGPLEKTTDASGNGPARYYRFPGAPGKIGIISPLTHHFCGSCNRMRLTADGQLRTCLFSTESTDLRSLMRGGASDEEVAAAIRQAVRNKPEKHAVDREVLFKCVTRPMSSIGG